MKPLRNHRFRAQECIEFCKKNGAFDPKTMGACPNVGLMAQKVQVLQATCESHPLAPGLLGAVLNIFFSHNICIPTSWLNQVRFHRISSLVGGFKHEFYFPFDIWDVILAIDFHIFQDGYCTTNQFIEFGNQMVIIHSYIIYK